MAMALSKSTGLGTAVTASLSRYEPADGLMMPNCCCCCSPSSRASASAGINGRSHGWLPGNSTVRLGGQAGLQFRGGKEGASDGAFLAPRSQSSRVLHSFPAGGRRRRGGPSLRDDEGRIRRTVVSMGAVIDPHSIAFLADLINQADLVVRIDLDPAREIITERNNSQLSEEAIKSVYMVGALVFTWGCCVFGAMTDKFYDSEEYRKSGGDGTGHWIYDRQDREERAAREEIWSEDLLKEIEEKAQEVRQAEEKEKKKKDQEKEVELV